MTQVMDTDEFLEHFGVKGMKWGVRKERDSGSKQPHKVFNKRNAAIAGGVLAVGAGVAVAVLAKNGNIPMPEFHTNPQVRNLAMQGAKHAAEAQVRRNHEKALWDQKVKDMLADIDQAHADQTQHMLKTMSKLGTSYNPRANEFTPEARRLQIGR